VTSAYPDSWLHTELKRRVATIAELRVRLDATERHNADLLAVIAELRADLREAAAVVDLLKPTDRPVWQP
jgi:hypothetical protein